MDDFRERKITDQWIADYHSFCKKQWEDFSYKLAGGESLKEVQYRNVTALERVIQEYRGKNIVIASHGTALSTVVNYFDSSFGYEEFEKIRNVMPWVVRFTFEGDRCAAICMVDLIEEMNR